MAHEQVQGTTAPSQGRRSLRWDRTTVVLVLMTVFSLGLSAARWLYSGRRFLLFLIWNLFLALVPWVIAELMAHRRSRNGILTLALVLVWLVFFPNAPYLLTDLVHLGKDNGAPVWFDLILLLVYGTTGMLYGFASLARIEALVRRSLGWVHTGYAAVALIYLSGFGIYLGRFLRWNSWDLVVNTPDVVSDIAQHLAKPLDYPAAWIFTLLFGTLLSLLYFAFRPAIVNETVGEQTKTP